MIVHENPYKRNISDNDTTKAQIAGNELADLRSTHPSLKFQPGAVDTELKLYWGISYDFWYAHVYQEVYGDRCSLPILTHHGVRV